MSDSIITRFSELPTRANKITAANRPGRRRLLGVERLLSPRPFAELVVRLTTMTPDEICKAVTPNALRDAKPERLDELCNHANSLLLTSDPGEARQMQSAIQAIHSEKARRYAAQSKPIERWILLATVIGALAAILAFALELLQPQGG